MDRPPERYGRVRLEYDSPAGGRPFVIIGREGNGFYRLLSKTEQADFDFNHWGDELRVVTYAQAFSIVAHYSEFDLLDS